MKKILSGLICCILLCTGLLTTPASAASPIGQEHFVDGDYTFTKIAVDFSEGVATESTNAIVDSYCETFSDGYLLVSGADGLLYYLGTDGKVHDLNKGRFGDIHPFSGGLAAVIDKNNKVGYMNTSGELVIPCQYDPYTSRDSHFFPWVGQFADGKAWVFREDPNANPYSDKDMVSAFIQIDASGKVLQELPDEPRDEALNLFNLTFANNTTDKERFPDACTAPGIGAFQARFGESDTGLTWLYTGETDKLGNKLFVPYVVERKPLAQTRYQSTGELTNVFIAEMTFNKFTVTVTNPTDGYDSGTIALVVASHMGTVHFIDYELSPRESREYSVLIVGHVGLEGDSFRVILGKGWGAYMNAAVITFKSDTDRDAYRAAVVYEENLDYHVSQGAMEGNAYVVICNGQPGDDWFKSYTSIELHHKTAQDASVTHDICRRK